MLYPLQAWSCTMVGLAAICFNILLHSQWPKTKNKALSSNSAHCQAHDISFSQLYLQESNKPFRLHRNSAPIMPKPHLQNHSHSHPLNTLYYIFFMSCRSKTKSLRCQQMWHFRRFFSPVCFFCEGVLGKMIDRWRLNSPKQQKRAWRAFMH